MEWLGIKYNEKVIASNDMEKFYGYAERLISPKNAYVCFCNAQFLRENRAKSIECSCRNSSVENNLVEFNNMLTKYKESQAYFARALLDLQYAKSAQVYENAGLCAERMLDFKLAATYFQQALLHDPKLKRSAEKLAKMG